MIFGAIAPGTGTLRREAGDRGEGFTLVELLTVVAVVLVLATLLGVAASVIQRKAAVAKARTQLFLMGQALDRYKGITGCYPEGLDGTGLVVYKALYGDGVGSDGVAGTSDDLSPDGRTDPDTPRFMPDLDPATNPLGMVELSGPSGVPVGLVDPFGNRYRYTGGKHTPHWNPGFDLESAGPDGRWGTSDDLRM